MPGLAAPLRLVLASDSHVTMPFNPPARLERIADRINAEKPDIVLLAGDYINDKIRFSRPATPAAAIAPFARLRPRLGTVAVMGNHDVAHAAEMTEIVHALAQSRVRLLDNEVISLGGVTIGGIDFYKRRPRPEARARTAILATQVAPGPRILLAHDPAVVRQVIPGLPPPDLVLAGHTHCGQIALPFYGPIITATSVNRHLTCGYRRLKDMVLVVSGGLGTSEIPIRLFAPPEFWVIDLKPA